MSLAALKILKDKGFPVKVLLIAPKRVCQITWPAEIEEWADFNNFTYTHLMGKDREENLQVAADIYLINPEGLDWLLKIQTKPIGKNKKSVTCDVNGFKKLGFNILLIDELTKFKNHSGIRFKALRMVHKTFARRWGLTGSPASNGLMNLFGQCLILDEGRSLGPYITHFRNEYFIPGYDGYSWNPQEDAFERIMERIKPLCLSIHSDDVIELPRIVYNKVKVELPAKVWKTYKEVENDFFAMLEKDQMVTAPSSAAAGGKCRQIANGAVYLSTPLSEIGQKKDRKSATMHDEKIDALESLVEELQGAPLLVGYEFHHDYERLKVKFKEAVFVADLKDMDALQQFEKDWNKGKIPLAIAQISTVAHGLNLQKQCQHVCLFGMIWDFEVFEQFIQRVCRNGNPFKHIFCHMIIARGTVDERVATALTQKDATQRKVFKALK